MSGRDVITSTANPAIKALRRLVRRTGRSHGAVELVVEGPSAVAEAVGHVTTVFVTQAAAARHAGLVRRARDAGAEVVPVADDVFGSVAATVTPQGILAIATLPPVDADAVIAAASLLVVLHQAAGPGNAGAAIRTADAAGADAVIFTAGSVDPRGVKAARASAGSLFHLPVVTGVTLDEVVAGCRAADIAVAAVAADGELAHTDADLTKRTALVFGNEAHGLDDGARRSCDVVMRVPMAGTPRPGYSGTAESLNLAATVAVVAFEAARQRGVQRVEQAPHDTGALS